LQKENENISLSYAVNDHIYSKSKSVYFVLTVNHEVGQDLDLELDGFQVGFLTNYKVR